jgi:hypothetical protein
MSCVSFVEKFSHLFFRSPSLYLCLKRATISQTLNAWIPNALQWSLFNVTVSFCTIFLSLKPYLISLSNIVLEKRGESMRVCNCGVVLLIIMLFMRLNFVFVSDLVCFWFECVILECFCFWFRFVELSRCKWLGAE